jgi:hypothetical protein
VDLVSGRPFKAVNNAHIDTLGVLLTVLGTAAPASTRNAQPESRTTQRSILLPTTIPVTGQ